jgi:Glucose-6-phosphate dehydrogenase, C-terminal domain
VLRGDQTNFVHADELIASWRIFTPALHELKARRIRPEPYVYGSAGPASENAFAARFGFPLGFAHGHDNEARRQAIAWGKSSVVSVESRRSSTGSHTGPLPNGSEDGTSADIGMFGGCRDPSLKFLPSDKP